MKEKILELAKKYEKKIIDIRRDIHKNPEVALKEFKTAALVGEVLESLGFEVTKNVGQTGVVGILRGKGSGKTIMLRADMDALNIEELNEVSYKSSIPGKMHACGHDAHTSWLLGAAMILKDLKDQFDGCIKFVFQPAEEGIGGAERMIKDGVLENPKVDAVIGAHIWPMIESGKIGVREGPLMAAPAKFEIKVMGKGGHGAEPHNCIDPITIACQLQGSLQSVISRRIDPTESVVLSVTQFHSGTAHNIIPSEAVLSGTVRTLTPEMEGKIPKLMEEMVKGVVEAHGGRYEFEYKTYYPAVINDLGMTKLVRDSGARILGHDHVIEMEKPSMAGEDFSYYQKEVPGVFFMVGTRNEDMGIIYPLHNPRFDVDESVIIKASCVIVQCALDYLAG